MANKELANQWKHGCMHGMYAWNDLGTPTAFSGIRYGMGISLTFMGSQIV